MLNVPNDELCIGACGGACCAEIGGIVACYIGVGVVVVILNEPKVLFVAGGP